MTISFPDFSFNFTGSQISFSDYAEKHITNAEQRKVALAISECKTGKRGFSVSVCDTCEHVEIHNASCRNRHCPVCQGIKSEVWVEERRAEVLDVPYYHVVFTVPDKLHPLFKANKELLYNLLFQASSQTLLTLAKDRKYLGATPGIIQVLHTWGQTLVYHPHMHCILSGAGLTRDRKLVIGKRKSFFAPIKVAMVLFRGKFMAELKQLYSSGDLEIPQSCDELKDGYVWKEYVDTLYKTDWCGYIKQTFNGYGNAIDYLARYTNRIAISNAHVISIADKKVVFKYRDYKDNYTAKLMTLTHEESIRRFLLHVLPKGFQKIYKLQNNLSNRYEADDEVSASEITMPFN